MGDESPIRTCNFYKSREGIQALTRLRRQRLRLIHGNSVPLVLTGEASFPRLKGQNPFDTQEQSSHVLAGEASFPRLKRDRVPSYTGT
jgi:hypothetical protein